jgi:hypothetical protein
MVVGRDTFAGDLLARLGVVNVYAGHPERYPRIGLDELRSCGAGLVVLPDEPYPFSRDDGPEAFPGLPAALVSGRHLTWYGPSLAEAGMGGTHADGAEAARASQPPGRMSRSSVPASAASGYGCPVDDAAESFVAGVVVAPDDVPSIRSRQGS